MARRRRSTGVAAVLAGRTLSFREFEKAIVDLGFRLERVRGSHRIYAHPMVPRPLNIQPRGKDAKGYQVQQCRDMILEFNLLSNGE